MVELEQQQPSEKPSDFRRLVAALHPRAVWAMADGYPPVIKQFLQFCLILVYPGWVVGVGFAAGLYAVAWVLFWPVRAWMKSNRPEDYAASQLK